MRATIAGGASRQNASVAERMGAQLYLGKRRSPLTDRMRARCRRLDIVEFFLCDRQLSHLNVLRYFLSKLGDRRRRSCCASILGYVRAARSPVVNTEVRFSLAFLSRALAAFRLRAISDGDRAKKEPAVRRFFNSRGSVRMAVGCGAAAAFFLPPFLFLF